MFVSVRFKEYPSYDKPPFDMDGLHEMTVKKKVGSGKLIPGDTGELMDAAWWGEEFVKIIDRKTYIKLFVEGQAVMSKLSSAGVLVMTEILSRLRPNTSSVRIRQAEVVGKHTNLKGAGFYKGMCELLQYGVIARSKEPNEYYINPNMFFNGDRTRVFRNNKNKAQ